MLKRPLNPRFNQPVLQGRKITTIRNNPWPVSIPIMLYNWTGAAYRSKQANVVPVIVTECRRIMIAHLAKNGAMRYACEMETGKPLYQTEGFDSPAEMDAWFRRLVKPGKILTATLIDFRLAAT